MPNRKPRLLFFLRVLVLAAALSSPVLIEGAYSTTVSFSGYVWQVKTSKGRVGPGPNYFSDGAGNVWVDAQGRLHLTIRKTKNRWDCAEVVSNSSFGYGTYRWYLDTPVDNLDRNVVLGLFTWNDAADYNHREVDFEASRWGNAADPTNAQYVVQPYDVAGNLVRFSIPSGLTQTTHAFTWRSTSVAALSLKGSQATPATPSDVLYQHTFTAGIPVAGGENARANLWLYQGRAPSNGQSVEIVIKKFEFVP